MTAPVSGMPIDVEGELGRLMAGNAWRQWYGITKIRRKHRLPGVFPLDPAVWEAMKAHGFDMGYYRNRAAQGGVGDLIPSA